jgi:O-antigen/teichoic acid export membrane protein
MSEDRPAPESLLPAPAFPHPPERPTAAGFLGFASANALAFALSVLASFQLPLWVSQADYGSFRVLLLYLGFSGVLHWGLLDYTLVTFAERGGVGGRQAFVHNLLELLRVAGGGAVALLALGPTLAGDFTLGAALAVNALLQNVATFGEIVLQTSGRFKRLNAIRLGRAALWVGSLWGLHLVQGIDIASLLTAYTGVQVVACLLLLTLALPASTGSPPNGPGHTGPGTMLRIRYGLPILAGGVLLLMVANADRNFLSIMVPRERFAVYAFGAMLLTILRDLLLSARTYLFPYLAREDAGSRQSRFDQREFSLAALLAGLAILLVPLCTYGPAFFPTYGESFRLLPFLYVAFASDAISTLLHDSYLAALKLNKDILRLAVGLAVPVYLALLALPSILPDVGLETVARLGAAVGLLRFVAYGAFLRRRLHLGWKGVLPAAALLIVLYLAVELGSRFS